MDVRARMDQCSGSGKYPVSFEEIDQRYHLKMRAFIKLCMPPVFKDLERHFDLEAMRRRGIIPIMFHLTFESSDIPLVFLSVARMTHQVRLCRSVTEPPGAAPIERLLLDMRIQIHAPRGSGDPKKLGASEAALPEVRVGAMRALQVLTRPVAPPGERQVVQVPDELSGLNVHPLDEPFPVPEHLAGQPAGFAPAPEGPFPSFDTVWSLPNTDVNQHVNVQEYVMGMENHFARRLHGAGLPVARHRIARAQLVFRKPFFPGETVRVQGPLLVKGAQTLLIGGYHRLQPDGSPEGRPSVAVRMEGVLDAPA
jgi:hypothetical protein